MSNRRTKSSRGGRTRAPRDHEAPPEGSGSLTTRSVLRWFLLGAKVTVGFTLISVAVGALAWGVYRYAQTTPRFAVVKIELEGTKRLKREDILGAAGLHRGSNLFALDTAKVEAALRDSPWIASAQVSRQLPGTVRIVIRERLSRAIAVIGGKNFLVSQDALPFKEMGQGDPHDLPLITGVSPEALRKDRRAELARLGEALALLRDYEKLAFSQKYPVQELHLERSGRASLVIGDEGTTLHLGTAPWKKKLLRAERVLEKSRRQGARPGIAFLDNEAHPERVVVRVQ